MLLSELNSKCQNYCVTLFEGSSVIESGIAWNNTIVFSAFEKIEFHIVVHGIASTIVIRPEYKEGSYCFMNGYIHTDGHYREYIVQFATSGRYLTNVKTFISIDRGAWATVANYVYIAKIVGYRSLA